MQDDLIQQNNFTSPDDLRRQPPFVIQAPFVIEHRQEDHALSGTFRPSARLVLTERVRTSGLWRALTPEDAKTLIFILTFVTPNGWCRPTLPELADAMGTSRPKAKGRLDRLMQARWKGHPLAQLLPRPDGLDAYLPGRELVIHEEMAEPEPPQAAPVRTPGREAVIAYSRARYARTREEVEAQIEEMMGWGPPAFAGDDPAVAEGKQKAFQAMTNLGMPKEQALDLLSRFDLGEVERQIAWLPSRSAKNPARFLAAAIEGGYDQPLSLRRPAGPVEGASGSRGNASQGQGSQAEAQGSQAGEGQPDPGDSPTNDDSPTNNGSNNLPDLNNLPER